MKKLVVGILLLIMAAIPQYTQAATYNGNIIQNVNEYVHVEEPCINPRVFSSTWGFFKGSQRLCLCPRMLGFCPSSKTGLKALVHTRTTKFACTKNA